MVAIRNSALRLLVMGLLTYGAASAQFANLECEVSGTPATVRSEGVAELLGDIEYECTRDSLVNPAPGPDVFVNFLVELDVPVSNNVRFGEPNPINGWVTDAVMTINGDNCDEPSPVGDSDNCSGDYQDPQYGVVLTDQGNDSTLSWDGVRIPFPGELNSESGLVNPDVTRIRITSMRGNAASLGTPISGAFEISAFLDSQPATVLQLDEASVTVARSRVGLIQLGVSEVSGLQCIAIEGSGQGDSAVLRFREGFASAFKTIGVPSFVPGTQFWESGYYAPNSNNDGGASQATQFAISFAGIPDDVTITAPGSIPDVYSPGFLYLVPVGNNCVNNGDFNLTPDVSGNDVLIYEVCDSNPLLVEQANASFPVSWNIANPPAVGVGTLGVAFWPQDPAQSSREDAASNSIDREPRFVDTSDPENFLNVEKCVTTLLFPFVTNQSGFDTGLAISNTSDDWDLSNALPQDGGCVIHYLGTDTSGVMPADDATTTDVEAGDQAIWLLSSGGSHGLVGAPDFQGYIFAACEFQYAHGYAFITDGFGGGVAPALAQGYLALVVPGDRTISTATGESLGH